MEKAKRILSTAFILVTVLYPFAPVLTVKATSDNSFPKTISKKVETAKDLAQFSAGLKGIDSQKPMVFSVINRGDKFTRDGLVDVSILVHKALSKDNDVSYLRSLTCVSKEECLQIYGINNRWSTWQPIPSSFTDTYGGKFFSTQMMLAAPASSGIRYLCFQVQDTQEVISPMNDYSCDDITLDNVAPFGTVVINNGLAETNSLDLVAHLTATDGLLADGSQGVGGIEYSASDDRHSWKEWLPITGQKEVTGRYPIELTQPTRINGYVKFRDSLGNESDVFSDDIYFSPAHYSQYFRINNGETFTSERNINLYLFPQGVPTQIKVWEKGQNSDQVRAAAFASSLSWSLSEGYGEKLLYVQYLYGNGTVSEPVAAGIIYAPVLGVNYGPTLTGYGEYTIGKMPSALSVGANFNMTLSVRNTGSETWLQDFTAKAQSKNAFHVSYHWFRVDRGAKEIYEFEGNRGQLNRNVDYAEADTSVLFSVAAPTEPGKYILQFDAVLEAAPSIEGDFAEIPAGGQWFSSFGNSSPEYVIDITVGQEGLGSRLGGSLLTDSNVFESSSTQAAFYYTVQPGRPWDPTWRCAGFECYRGIAEEFYNCSALGIANDVPDTVVPALLMGKCWWPIYEANKLLYVGKILNPYYRARPWQYLEVGWRLFIPSNPWDGSGPNDPSVPILPPNPGSFLGLHGATPDDPFAGINGAYSEWPEITFDRFISWDGSNKSDQIKWSETKRPSAPKITALSTNDTGTNVTVYGTGIPKNMPMHVKVWNEFRYCWACGSGWEFFYQQATAQHVKVAIFKETPERRWIYLDEVWNDSPDGRWVINLPLGGELKPGDLIKAEIQVQADYTFYNLHWWSDTTENVNFDIRNPKYFGVPYFASEIGIRGVVPDRALTDYEWAIKYRETISDKYEAAGGIHEYCGAWMRDYNYLTAPADGWITYSNLIYNPRLNWAFRLRGDIRLAYWNKYGGSCGSLGLPATDDLLAAVSPSGTTGSYQKFDGGIVHSSRYGTFSSTGKIYELHTGAGGTARYGFPMGEMYQENGQWCQLVEEGKLCESGFEKPVVPATITYLKEDDLNVLVVDLHNPEQVCLKSHVGIEGKIGDKDPDGSLKKNFKASKFSELVNDDNAYLGDERPVASFNTDYVDMDDSPMDINYVQGHDYSGWRNWTSMVISRENNIEFTTNKGNYYNVVGGGPRIFQDGNFTDPCNAIGGTACHLLRQRTVVGVTDNNKMIAIVTGTLFTNEIDDKLNLYAARYGGKIVDGNLFDGGGSPSMVYKGDIKREGNNLLSAALLVFEGDACKHR
ncbi:MAG: phosphodiester glycosidase family protein [Candidatus Doudnabacteria bacterium]|nr:phosphodiester glycosidase family protein [Candidatus Doudnabacteria bacterium]